MELTAGRTELDGVARALEQANPCEQIVDSAHTEDWRLRETTLSDRAARRATRGVRRAQRTPARRLRAWSATVALVLVVGVGTPVAALRLYDTQTGEASTGGEAVAPAEWLDAQQHDFAEYAATLMPEWLPLPDGVDREKVQSVESQRLAEAYGHGMVQDVTVRAHFEFAAQCIWIDEALLAHESGDAHRLAVAVAALGAAPGWPDIVASDGGGVSDAMRQTAAHAAGGDFDQLNKRIGCLSDWRVATYEAGR